MVLSRIAPRVALAKAAGDGEPASALSLADHAADVAAVFRALLEEETLRRRLARLAGLDDIDPLRCDRLAVLAALHDAGKVTVRFQRRIRGEAAAGGGHIRPLLDLLAGLSDDREVKRVHRAVLGALRLPLMAGWFAEPEAGLSDMLAAVLAHHGALPAPERPRLDDWTARDGYDPLAALAGLAEAVEGWFPVAFRPGGPPLPSDGRFLYALAGLTVWADRLGSDVTAFPLCPADAVPAGPGRFGWSRQRAAAVLERRHLAAGPRRSAARSVADWRFGTLLPSLAGHAPRPMQGRMLALEPPPPGAVLVLEAETGSGKTEAAVLLFLTLLRQGLVDGMYFALPTRASAAQIQRRLAALLPPVLGDTAPVGLAVPGYLRVDADEGARLPGFEVEWPDRPDVGDRGWAVAHASRYLAGPVMVGTVDQLLMAGMRVRGAPFRAAAMLRQLLVVDEVHASDPYMAALLAQVLDQQRAAGGYTLLMSATLGAALRLRLTGGDPRALPPLEACAAAPYPMLHLPPGMEPAAHPGEPERPASRRVTVETVPPDALEAVVAEALAAAKAGARVLILRNTVKEAQRTQALLEDAAGRAGGPLFGVAGVPAPHHARFAAEDRGRLDTALEAAFGKDRAGGDGLVAVATQTAEQSLDIDADLLVTDLCPADVLLQRLGRLHRHARARPAGFEAPRALVLAPALPLLAGLIGTGGEPRGGPAGLGRVYPDLLALAATLLALEGGTVLELPAMNRRLVEGATHPEARERLAAELARRVGGGWAAHANWAWGRDMAGRRLADLAALDWRVFDAQRLESETADERLRTRLGLDDRRVELPDGTAGPFGGPVSAITVPGWLVMGEPADTAPAVVAVAGACLALRYPGRTLVYDRLGLRRA